MRFWTGNVTAVLILVTVAFAAMRVAASEATLRDAIDLFDQQEYGEARRVLEDLPQEARETAQALYYLGRLDLIDGEDEKAAEYFERAIDVDAEQSEYHHWLAMAVMRRTPYRNVFGRMMSATKAVKAFKKAIELDPANLRPRMTLFQMMVRSYDMGGVKREDLAQEVEAIAGIDSVMGHVARGTFYQLVEKDMDRAGVELKRSLDLAPENRAAAISYADFLWETGMMDEAIGVLASFVERVPDDKSARLNLGMRTMLRGEDYARAKGLFEACLGLKSDTGMPSETAVRWCLGLAFHLMGEEGRAQKEWSIVYTLDERFDRILERMPQMSELNSLLAK
jgi:tetratricopeptide (TPR) repeat protein